MWESSKTTADKRGFDLSMYIKRLLTKVGYITKINIIAGVGHKPQLYQLKKSNLTKIFLFKAEGWYSQAPTEIMMS